VTARSPAAPVRRLRGRWPAAWQRLKALAGTKLARDHLLTLVTELGVMGASLVVLKLAASYAGPAGFGEFVLARRMIGFIQLPVLCGVGLALTRAVAMVRGGGSAGSEWGYLDAALVITGCASLFAAVLLIAGARPFAAAALGASGYALLARALAPGVVALVLHGVAYGLLRGRQTMVPANLLQALNLGLIPLGVFLIPGLAIPQLVGIIGSCQLTLALVTLAGLRARGPRPAPLGVTMRREGTELLRYGAPRVPGEFVLGALSALPVTAAAHYGGAVEAGYVGLGLSLLTLVGSLFAPLGQVMLPAISAQVASGRTAGLARQTWLLTVVCAGLTALGVILIEVLAPWLLPAVFGPEFGAAVGPVRLIVLGAVPYVLYIVLRNVLDAIHAAPLNAVNLVVALGAFGLVLGIGRGSEAVAPAVLVTMTVLGSLTAWRAWRVLKASGQAA
jgi:O-antigen/teichoic acid export membrane protein